MMHTIKREERGENPQNEHFEHNPLLLNTFFDQFCGKKVDIKGQQQQQQQQQQTGCTINLTVCYTYTQMGDLSVTVSFKDFF